MGGGHVPLSAPNPPCRRRLPWSAPERDEGTQHTPVELWDNGIEDDMCEHLGQAATGTMGRDFKTTMDWSALYRRDLAVMGEHLAESCLRSNVSRGGGSGRSRRWNSLMQRQLTYIDWAALLLKSELVHQDFLEEERRQRTTGPASPAKG